MKRFICLFLCALFFNSNGNAQVDYGHCKTIITDGLREIDISTDSSAYLNTVFDKYCESGGSAKESSLSLGIDAVIEAIPFKFLLGGSDKKQSMRNFCKEYASYAAGSRDSYRRSEKIVARAYESFDICVQQAAQGVKISHKVRTIDQIDFFVAPAVGRPVILNGIQTSANMKCSGRAPDGFLSDGKVQQITLDTKFTMKTSALNIVCERAPSPADRNGIVVYEEGVVTLLTDIQPMGNYGVVLPRDSRLPDSRALEIQERIEKQQAAIASLNQNMGFLLSPVTAFNDSEWSKSIGGGAGHTAMIASCPVNQVVVGVEIYASGTCHNHCDEDGGTIHKFKVRCAPRSNLVGK